MTHMTTRPTLVDLCCGAGGFSAGMRTAGWTPLLGVDICKYSLATFRHNFGSRTASIDLTLGASAEKVASAIDGGRRLDAVVAGPPCQGFSLAGARARSDPRNDVLAACVRVAVRLGPRVIVVENVPTLTSKYRNHLTQCMRIFRRNGYRSASIVLNANDFGLAQRRRRLIVVAVRMSLVSGLDGLLEELRDYLRPNRTVREAFAGLPNLENGNGIGKKAANHEPMDHSDRVKRKIARIRPGHGPLSYRKLDPEGIAGTLVCGHRAFPCHFAEARAITVREAARLQGFSDRFVFKGPQGNQMAQVANAVPPRMAAVIGRMVRKLLSGSSG